MQILGEDPYTAQQLHNNTVCLLLQCGLYTRDFEDWDCKTVADKIWTNLKTFVQEWYTHRLNATSINAGSQGYVQIVFAALGEESEDNDNDVQTVITQMAALIHKVNSHQSQRLKHTLRSRPRSINLPQTSKSCNSNLLRSPPNAPQHISHFKPHLSSNLPFPTMHRFL